MQTYQAVKDLQQEPLIYAGKIAPSSVTIPYWQNLQLGASSR